MTDIFEAKNIKHTYDVTIEIKTNYDVNAPIKANITK